MALKKGNQAPSFSLFNTEKKEVSLANFEGKNLVILFFPLAFTSVCTAELCEMRDRISVYASLNAEIVGISVDSLFTLGKFKEELNLPFDLLSDFNKETSATYGSLYENFVLGMKGVSKRSAFIVDAGGKIQYAEVLEDAGQVPSFASMKEVLAGL